ncbi:alpha/beta fold hydrolase [Dechloromonas sp. H13]|uniref:alpha/beta fold hydrolase n=1 Tax=Dechloromonas sp. H13 TaxID=2570193 RepID=UPI001291C696|nr:alpha/beta fold hydrolase [Dechloromonas sp. H13]
MADAEEKPAAAPGLGATLASIVNGCFGDYLSQRDNGLAIDMAFYQDNRPLPLTPVALAAAIAAPSARLCVLVHGLCCHEGAWGYPGNPGRSYGSALHADLGFTPFFLRYNTGLPIPYNGKSLDTLLEQLLATYPHPVEELVLLGHSMGGLVLRGACHFGAERGAAWVGKVSRIFYIGTPHEGAALEKIGHLVNSLLHAVPHPVTHLLGDVASQRSQGIKDLRHGTVLDGVAGIAAGPWLASAQHYMIAGTVTDDPEHLAARLFGDGLVQPPQAGENVRVFPGIDHMQLAHDDAVYNQIRTWCASA